MKINRGPNVPQDAALRRFTQLGLLVGSFTSWEKDTSASQPQSVEDLVRWSLQLPPVSIHRKRYCPCLRKRYCPCLGVSVWGFAVIYYTILQAKKRQKSFNQALEADEKRITNVLTHLKIPSATSILEGINHPHTNYERYEYHHFVHCADDLDRFAKYAKEAENLSNNVKPVRPHFGLTPRRMMIWLHDEDDIDWWLTAMRKTLNDFRDEELSLSEVTRLGERLECSIFAPLDISQKLEMDDGLLDGLNEEKRIN